jgi:hypothetical protein
VGPSKLVRSGNTATPSCTVLRPAGPVHGGGPNATFATRPSCSFRCKWQRLLAFPSCAFAHGLAIARKLSYSNTSCQSSLGRIGPSSPVKMAAGRDCEAVCGLSVRQIWPRRFGQIAALLANPLLPRFREVYSRPLLCPSGPSTPDHPSNPNRETSANCIMRLTTSSSSCLVATTMDMTVLKSRAASCEDCVFAKHNLDGPSSSPFIAYYYALYKLVFAVHRTSLRCPCPLTSTVTVKGPTTTLLMQCSPLDSRIGV